MYETLQPSNSEMNFNPYTPPSSNEDSPQSFAVNSPPSYYLLNAGTPMYMETTDVQGQFALDQQFNLLDEKRPCLVMIEQPTEKFRFRYKSEMAGTHGSLNGKTSDKTRKQTFPTVELKNYNGSAIIRCSLYQCHTSSKEPQPHPHRLIKKMGNEEVDDPHSFRVGGSDGYLACFHSMGIIHTAKKNLIDELCRKKILLKKEEVARKEGKRELRRDEVACIKHEAEEESKTINMNTVCLRFDAFVENEAGVLIPLCPPIYSHAINNLKSALTGELKIVRMDHSSSPAKGNREIFMLVEKVTKKNIRIRFYEVDEDGYETWSADGRFTELDVHHQYAIVFRTPPYHDQQITEPRKVFVELMRKTDSSRSEPREFKYYPSPNYQPGMKRSRMSSNSFTSSESFYTSGDQQAVLPSTIADPTNELPSIDSEEFNVIFQAFGANLMDAHQLTSVRSEDFVGDGPQQNFNDRLGGFFEMKLSKEEIAIVDRVENEFKSFLATNPDRDLVTSMLLNLFDEYVTPEQENALHLWVKSGNAEKLSCWLEVIKRSNQLQILNAPNNNGHTIGHLAVIHSNNVILNMISRYSPDFNVSDNDGNTPLHLAISRNSPNHIVDLLVRAKDLTHLNLNAENNDSETALHMAVSKKHLPYVRLLCEHGANANVTDKKTGYNVLHTAIIKEAVDVLKYLVEKTNVNLEWTNYQEMTPLQMAKRLGSDSNNRNYISIINVIETAMQKRGLNTEIFIKEEQESEDEMECDFVECKPEKYSQEELKEMYKHVKMFTSECLREVSYLLDESGKWENLAQLLDMQHIVYTKMFENAPSKAKQLLQSAEKECDLYNIRDFLENLEEHDAVIAMDKMVFSLQNT